MDARRRTSWRRGLCCVLVAVGGAALADEKPGGLEGGEKVSVSYRLLVTWTRGVTAPASEMTQDLDVGQAMVADAMHGTPFSYGVAEQQVADGCGITVGLHSVEESLGQQSFAWMADAKVLEASPERLVLSTTWKRFTRGDDGKPVVSAGESDSIVTLGEGDRVLLDYVPTPNSSCTRNAALELTAGFREDPALAARQVAYDLWLVHETSGGSRTTERAQLTARHGEKAAFAFPSQRLPAATGRSEAEELQVTVSGHVRGRIRRDGTVQLALGTLRALSYIARDTGLEEGDNLGEFGEKTLSVKPGDAIRVELPGAPRGNSRSQQHMSGDLTGHSFALIVTAKPV